MIPVQFATSEELESFMGPLFFASTPFDADRADFLLQMASAAVQTETRQTLALVEDDVLTIRGSYRPEILLPERPAVSVASVTIDGAAVSGYTLVQDTLAFLNPPYSWGDPGYGGGYFGGRESVVRITYTHGWADGDDHLQTAKLVTLSVAKQLYEGAAGEKIQETIGDSSYSTSTQLAAQSLISNHRETLGRAYKRTSMSLSLS